MDGNPASRVCRRCFWRRASRTREDALVRDEQVYAADRAAWRAWLEAHGDRADGVWVVYDRGPEGLGYDAIVEESLCFGWVDSQGRGLDEARTMLWVAPRKKGSGWARTNKVRIERLTAEGRMTAAGIAAVDRAKADGTWSLLDDVENLTEPPDLVAALDGVPAARATWDAFPRSAKRAILEWIVHAKRPATRAARIAETVSEAEAGRRANQWPRTPAPESAASAAPAPSGTAGTAT
jgi:uncharacterized protein YdeI (YjbR/CyaY-like superfamily)